MSSLRQVIAPLEEVQKVVGDFRAEVIKEYHMLNDYSCEVQNRGISLNFERYENVKKLSDDEITYFIRDNGKIDRMIAFYIIRRNSANVAEITMVKI